MLNRRTLLLASGASLLAPACSTPTGVVHDDLYARAIVIDCNIVPPLSSPLEAADREAIVSSGITTVKASIGGFAASYADTVSEIEEYETALRDHPDLLMQVRTAADIEAVKRARKFGIIFSFEGVACLEGKIERIEEFARRGVKVMQLSYNLPSPFGAGVLSDPSLGLTDLGREAIARMNALGVALDLSHANPNTTAAAMAASAKPVLMTHGGCTAVHAHPRNKTDEQLRALAAKGGVFGIYDLPYLTETTQPTLDDYMAHITHALDVCGEDHVGIGSDTSFTPFDTSPESVAAFQESVAQRRAAGVSAPGEDRMPYVIGLNTPMRCQIIADALRQRGYGASAVEKVLGLNFLRAFREIW